MMRWRALMMGLTLHLVGPTFAKQAAPGEAITEEDAAAIRRLLGAQLQAFFLDDAKAAFELASPDVREKWGTPERYLEMVRAGYGAAYQPRTYEFGELAITPWGVGQFLYVTRQDGQPQLALCLMQRQEDGQWRSDGCMLFSPDEESSFPCA